MSELINSLNSIYNTKLAIKEVIGTNSDNFSEYPSLIEEAISGGVSGYSYITSNGDYDISSYEYVNVNVQGGVAVLGDLSVSENGLYSASSYAYDGFRSVNVNVPVPPGYVLPSGTQIIAQNGNFDVKESAYVSVNVSGSSTITVSGRYLLRSNENSNTGYDKYVVYDSTNSTYYTLANELGYYGAPNNPKLGDIVSVTGNVIYGNIIKPTTYSISTVGSYEYVDISSFGLSGYGSENIGNIIDGYYNSDVCRTFSYLWNAMGGDNYGIDFISNGFNHIHFDAGNTITAYIYKEGDGTGYDYYTYTYYIRDIVSNIAPPILGMSYSLDGGMNWTNMDYDSSTSTYSFDGINATPSMGNYTPIRFDIGNGNYQYMTGGMTFNVANTDYTNSISKSTMFENFSFWNYTQYSGIVSGSINSTGTAITARLNADSSVYKFVHEYSNGDATLTESITMNSDTIVGDGWKSAVPNFNMTGTNNNYYVAKYPDEMSATPTEILKPSSDQVPFAGMANQITLSNTGTGTLETTPSNQFNGNKVYFKPSNGGFYWDYMTVYYVKDSNDNTLASFKDGTVGTCVLSSSTDIHITDSNSNNYYPDMSDSITPIAGSPYNGTKSLYNDAMYSSNTLTLGPANYTFGYNFGSEGMNIIMNIVGEIPVPLINVISESTSPIYTTFNALPGAESMDFAPTQDDNIIVRYDKPNGGDILFFKMNEENVELNYLNDPDWQDNDIYMYSTAGTSGNYYLPIKAGKRYKFVFTSISNDENDIRLNIKAQTII